MKDQLTVAILSSPHKKALTKFAKSTFFSEDFQQNFFTQSGYWKWKQTYIFCYNVHEHLNTSRALLSRCTILTYLCDMYRHFSFHSMHYSPFPPSSFLFRPSVTNFDHLNFPFVAKYCLIFRCQSC